MWMHCDYEVHKWTSSSLGPHVDEFIIKSMSGRVHQSTQVHPNYSPTPLGDKYILTCVHKDGQAYTNLKIRINT